MRYPTLNLKIKSKLAYRIFNFLTPFIERMGMQWQCYGDLKTEHYEVTIKKI